MIDLDPIVAAALCLPAILIAVGSWPRFRDWMYQKIIRLPNPPLPWEKHSPYGRNDDTGLDQYEVKP